MGGTLNTGDSMPANWEIGDLILGRYEVRDIFSGGMGKVYRVFDRLWQRELAVKTPNSEFFSTPTTKEGFEKECLTWISLGLHPNIVPCYYISSFGNVMRVYSEFISAGSLQLWIKSKRLYQEKHQGDSIRRILDIAIQSARGLEYAHSKNVIHCDVKPANILVSDAGSVLITDFGLAKTYKSERVQKIDLQISPDSIVCSSGGLTPAYCSPEQVYDSVVTRRTDIWSWGVTVLEMLSGSIFWPDGRSANEALRLYSSGQINNTAVKVHLLPKELINLLAACFLEDEIERPQNFGVIEKALYLIYKDFTGNEYPLLKPTHTDLDAPSLNNKAISFVELGKYFNSSGQSANSIIRELRTKHHDYEIGFINEILMEWRELGMPVNELNRRLDNFVSLNTDEEIIACKLSLELEKLDLERAEKQARLLSENSCFKQETLNAVASRKESIRRDLEEFFCTPSDFDLNETMELLHQLFCRDYDNFVFPLCFARPDTNLVAFINTITHELVIFNYKMRNVVCNIKLDRPYSRIAISENAKLVAVCSCKGFDTEKKSYRLSVFSVREGKLQGSAEGDSIWSQANVTDLTIDDMGKRVSIWWRANSSVYEGVHDFCDGKLGSYRLDFRKVSCFRNFDKVVIEGSAKYLLFLAGKSCILWQNMAIEPHADALFNLFDVDFGYYEVRNRLVQGFLPGLEPYVDYSKGLACCQLYRFMGKLLSLKPSVYASYIVCQPSTIDEQLQRKSQRLLLWSQGNEAEKYGDIQSAITFYSECALLGGGNQELVFARRHSLVKALDKFQLTRAWPERTYDQYWEGDILGLNCEGNKIVIQGYNRVETVEMPELTTVTNHYGKFYSDKGKVIIGLAATGNNHFLVYAHETQPPYSNKLVLAENIGGELQDKWVVNYEAAPGWNWPIKRLAVTDRMVFAETKPGIVNRIALSDGQMQEIDIGTDEVSFIRKATAGDNACIFIAFSRYGYEILDFDGKKLDFTNMQLARSKSMRIEAVSDDLSAVVCWLDKGKLAVFTRHSDAPAIIWENDLFSAESNSFLYPHSIVISPCGKAVALGMGGLIQIKCALSGRTILEWKCPECKSVVSMAFDKDSRWLIAAHSINIIEQFQLYWS
ncbi:MAG: hypothetical protein CVV42_02995 [Candidatus Riflebacteria bacterium HGW-Riflebacteria-2]|jgi:serine/threonine protein kinase|nr:MAG: hypothetical protein CVV42_02995 [Candidatus Riflebacteria bacterium HGW-Riflebacteria-2]